MCPQWRFREVDDGDGRERGRAPRAEPWSSGRGMTRPHGCRAGGSPESPSPAPGDPSDDTTVAAAGRPAAFASLRDFPPPCGPRAPGASAARPPAVPPHRLLTSWTRDRPVGRGTAEMTDAANARKSLTLAKTAPRLLQSREPRAESREPRAESREPRAESREPRAESREPRAESREPRESRERECGRDRAAPLSERLLPV